MTKSQISANSWLLLLVISLLIVNAHAAWLSDVPGEVTLPDGTKISILWSGDEFHHWAHDESYYTMIQDPSTGYWCWATVEKGDLVSTGNPIHLSNPQLLGLIPNMNISHEIYQQLRTPFDIDKLAKEQ